MAMGGENRDVTADGVADKPGTEQVSDTGTMRGVRRPKQATRTAGLAARKGAHVLSERELLVEISAKLDRVVAVLATQGRDRDAQVAILARAGCDSAFVASLVGMSPGAVRKLPAWRRVHNDGAEGTSEEPT